MKKDELKYPIKYAIMPVEEEISWNCSQVVAYIVSKCYVVGVGMKYSSHGNLDVEYEVVFPCIEKNNINFCDFELATPTYMNCSRCCTNSTFVDHVFTHYDDALSAVDQLNYKVLRQEHIKAFDHINKKMTYQEILGQYKERVNRYKEIEKTIEIVNQDKKISLTLEDIIKKIVDPSTDLYRYLLLLLSKEEEIYLKQLMENISQDHLKSVGKLLVKKD